MNAVNKKSPLTQKLCRPDPGSDDHLPILCQPPAKMEIYKLTDPCLLNLSVFLSLTIQKS